jgi:energy-coupling factor transporter transmembrane protein EcfT
MKKQTIFLLVIGLITLLFSVFLNYSGFIFLIALFVLIIVTTFMSIWKLIKRNHIKSLLKSAGIYFVIFTLGIIIGLFIPYKELLLAEKFTVSEQIQHIYDSDQSDRKSLKTYLIPTNQKLVIKRDSIRLEKATNFYLDYLKEKNELSNQDKFNLAMIFQHGKTTEDYEKAHALASEVAKSSSKIQNAEWLEKATYDRLQLSLGKPQKYGTQK